MADRRRGPMRPSLVAAAARGDVDALAEIMAAHHGDMARICMIISGNTSLAADAMQAAWVRADGRLAERPS